MAAELSISAKSGQIVFLDRDGVINRQAAPHQYICTWRDFIFLPDVPEAIRRLNRSSYMVLVVTNQRGVARNMMSLEDVNDIHQRMCRELENRGAHIDGIFVCPHEKGRCVCRKPEIGLFLQAEQCYWVDKTLSWMVGDSAADITAGIRYGVRTILLGNQNFGQDFSAKNLLEAVDIILGGQICEF